MKLIKVPLEIDPINRFPIFVNSQQVNNIFFPKVSLIMFFANQSS